MSTFSIRPVPTPLGRLELFGETKFVNSIQTLAELIKSVQDLNDWSDRDLGKRAEKMEITTSNFSRLKNWEIVSVKGSLVRILAQVLRVSEAKVARAAMVSMGVDPPIDEIAVDAAVRNLDEFSEGDRWIITSVLDAMRETRSETLNADQDKSRTNPPSARAAGAPAGGDGVGEGQKTSFAVNPKRTAHQELYDSTSAEYNQSRTTDASQDAEALVQQALADTAAEKMRVQ